MNTTKKIVAYILTLVLLVSVFPTSIFAEPAANEVRISNQYLSFTFNRDTGGFAIETLEGNPQKILDNNIPLLYADDRRMSNGTSFITVRIGDKDYIFGQDYSWYKLTSQLGEPVVSEEGRRIDIPWTIEGVTVTLTAALSAAQDTDITGNVGLSFSVVNNTGTDKNISIRLLLDTALGNKIDAPYFIIDDTTYPTLTETKYSDTDATLGNVPQQIRSVDSLSNPTKLSYILTKGWNAGTTPNNVILGHWANLANTRYTYEPDEYCDFTNYSNGYREPDSAAAIYWDDNTVSGDGTPFVGEVLYGVGNFSKSTGYPLGVYMSTSRRVELTADKKGYVNNGELDLNITLDNTVDNATELSNVLVNISTDDKKLVISSDDRKTSIVSIENETLPLPTISLKALPQNDLCAATIYVSVSGTKINADGTQESFETAAERSIILPSVGEVSEIQLNKINPEIVYTDGEKAVTISGKMAPLSALISDEANVSLRLVHETTGDEVSIPMDKLAFLDDSYETLTFTTSETLVVGEYRIVFDINDGVLKENLGCDQIECTQKLRVSADPKYRIKSYGMVALVRSTIDARTTYDFYAFGTEKEYLRFYNGDASAVGQYSSESLKYDFGSDKKAILKHEILLTVRANLREMKDPKTNEVFWEADFSDGDVIINNMLSYEGDTPLKVYKKGNEYKVEGDGLLKVVNSINVWRSKWSIAASRDTIYTLDEERFKKAHEASVGTESLVLSLEGAASLIQTVGGFAVDLKYGVLSSQWYDNSDGMVTYGIGFGGRISIPIKEKKGTNTEDNSGTGTGTDPNTTVGNAFPNANDARNRESDLEEVLTNTFGARIALEYMSGSITEEVAGLDTGTGGGSAGGSSGGATGGTGTGTSTGTSTGGTGTSTSSRGSTVPTVSSEGDVIDKKDDDLPEGKLSAEVNNVLFGEKGEVKNGYVNVDDTGFIGIDAKMELALPKNVLGSFVSNAPGLSASVTINTIENQYEIAAGLKIKIIECEGVLAFKQVSVKNKDVILPDKIEFYIRDGLKLPIAAPALYMTGLGGGINGLADTIGGEFDELPPITILLYTKLEAIGLLEGEFNATLSLEGMSLTGDMELEQEVLKKVLKINAGINARWIEPWELSLYGNVNIIDGVIKGGLTVTIADNYFYGYVFASICIPDSIPVVGGKELSSIEAAVSHEFIGTNIKIIGIKFGVIYYWGDKVSFGQNVNLSAPPRNSGGYSLRGIASDVRSQDAVGYYGTNVYALSATPLGLTRGADRYTETKINVTDAENQDALLIEIPYTGTQPTKDNMELYSPNGRVPLEDDENSADWNMMYQKRGNNSYVYVSVTDAALIENGEWTVRYQKDGGFEILSFNMNGVDDIPELDKTATKITPATATNETDVKVEWSITGDKAGKSGTIDVYLTEDKDILTKVQTGNNEGNVFGTNVYHQETNDLSTLPSETTFKLPDAMPNGSYYAVVTLSSTEGITPTISTTKVDFTNNNLPKDVDKVEVYYGGNSELFVKVTDPTDADYTHYMAEIVEDDGTTEGKKLKNSIGQFEKGSGFTFGKDAMLEAGKSYRVKVKTLKEEYKNSDGEYKMHYYYGTNVISSTAFEMPEAKIPKLTNVTVNFDTSGDDINTNVNDVIIEYTFDKDVFVEMDFNQSKVYAFGVNPDPQARSTYFRKTWKFVLDDLEDGDYVIDFAAYTPEKDFIKGSRITDVDNAYLTFTIDTSAPVLSLSKTSVTRKEDNLTVVFGTNTIIADENGKYTIEGLTENSAKLTLDGESITANGSDFVMDASGRFTITRTLANGETFKSHKITATDKAGNTSEITVLVVKEDSFSFDSFEIYMNGNPIATNDEGIKEVNIKNGQSATFSAYALSNGKKLAVDNDSVDWSVLYAKNALEMNNGSVVALSPAETAVKAKLTTASVTSGNSTRVEGLSDYVVINIGNNSRSDLVDKIDEAKNALAANPDASDSKKEALQNAITAAEQLVNDQQAGENDFTDGVTRLTQAISDFYRVATSGGSTSPAQYSATAKPSEHGKVELSQSKIISGNSLTITAIPDNGYVVADMLVNGKSVGRREVYTINSVKENIVVEVIFAEKTDLPFKDVVETDWFYPYVKTAYERGYMLGTSETEFEPDTTLTRAMFVTILYRIDAGKATSANIFNDVDNDAYYNEAVAWANENGIVRGVSENEFAPDDSITREQMSAILYRYAQYKSMDVSVGENTNILSYDDYNDISEYAVSAMQYTAGSGLMVGKSQTTLNPQDNATRAEAATVFVRFADTLK